MLWLWLIAGISAGFAMCVRGKWWRGKTSKASTSEQRHHRDRLSSSPCKYVKE